MPHAAEASALARRRAVRAPERERDRRFGGTDYKGANPIRYDLFFQNSPFCIETALLRIINPVRHEIDNRRIKIE